MPTSGDVSLAGHDAGRMEHHFPEHDANGADPTGAPGRNRRRRNRRSDTGDSISLKKALEDLSPASPCPAHEMNFKFAQGTNDAPVGNAGLRLPINPAGHAPVPFVTQEVNAFPGQTWHAYAADGGAHGSPCVRDASTRTPAPASPVQGSCAVFCADATGGPVPARAVLLLPHLAVCSPTAAIPENAAQDCWPASPCRIRARVRNGGMVSTSPPTSPTSPGVDGQVSDNYWPASPCRVRAHVRNGGIMSTSPPTSPKSQGIPGCTSNPWSPVAAGSPAADALRSLLRGTGLTCGADLETQLRNAAPDVYED